MNDYWARLAQEPVALTLGVLALTWVVTAYLLGRRHQ